MYSLLANFIAILHGIVIVFLFTFTWYDSLFPDWFDIVAFITAIIAVLGFFTIGCPLSILEKYLRNKASENDVYRTSFIGHYVQKIVPFKLGEVTQKHLDCMTGVAIFIIFICMLK